MTAASAARPQGPAEPIPLTVLTGFLGAGKTSLLNRLLGDPALADTVVIINEFGEIGLDHLFVRQIDDNMVMLQSGCLCCTLRGDLVTALETLLRDLDNGRVSFRRVVLETTGLADPAPVAQTFFIDDNVGRKAKLDAVVTVADAKWLNERLEDAPEAKNQIAFADVILLNKTDLVAPDELSEVEARIRGINPYAKLHRTERCKVALPEVLGRNAFDLDRILEIEPEFLGDGGHHHHEHDDAHEHDHDDHHHHHGGSLKHYHDEEIQSVSLKTERPIDPDKFFPWVQQLVQTEGPNILRCKGILSLKGDDARFVFQGVHMILDGDHQRPWQQGEKRESRIVFIGRNLPMDRIREGFAGCAA